MISGLEPVLNRTPGLKAANKNVAFLYLYLYLYLQPLGLVNHPSIHLKGFADNLIVMVGCFDVFNLKVQEANQTKDIIWSSS